MRMTREVEPNQTSPGGDDEGVGVRDREIAAHDVVAAVRELGLERVEAFGELGQRLLLQRAVGLHRREERPEELRSSEAV